MAVSIRSAACWFPESITAIDELFAQEGRELASETRGRLGIDSVHLCNGVSGSELARVAAEQALAAAGVAASQVDVIVDFTILPQEYLVPAWSMGNKLQADLGARKAFTLGFSAGGASNFQVALSSATALIASDTGVDTALLVAADVSIPGNRVLGAERPATVLGDGASSLVLQAGTDGDEVISTRMRTRGDLHDVCYIPGGAMEHPHRADLYRLELDQARATGVEAPLAELCRELIEAESIDPDDLTVTTTNISREDQRALAQSLDRRPDELESEHLQTHGHVQGTDLVLNYLSARDGSRLLLLASHGMGFMPAASLLRCAGGGA